MLCRICDIYLYHHSKYSFYSERLCKKCAYVLELFSFGGNRLKEYWVEVWNGICVFPKKELWKVEK